MANDLPESSGGLASTLGTVDSRLRVPEARPGDGLTDGQHVSLHWLQLQGGTGVITLSGRSTLAGGSEREQGCASLPFWTRLADKGLVTIERTRVTITVEGTFYCKQNPVGRTFEGVRHGKVERHPGLDMEGED